MARKITFAIFSILFSALFLIPSSSANASTTGTFYARSFTTHWRNGSGASGSWTSQFSGPSTQPPLTATGKLGSAESYTDLCINFDHLNLDSTAVSYNLSFTMQTLGYAPLSLGGGHQNNIVLEDRVNSSSSGTNENFDTFATHNVSGIAKNSGDQLCFTGIWAVGQNSPWLMTQPVLTTYPVDDSVVQSIDDVNNTLQENQKKEEQQREEDKKASEDASNNSQTSSEDTQSQTDEASKNLFQILTDFVGAVTSASPSSCSISGDFGFFNVGNIDVCSGASKIQPITTVVGTIMLIGLIIPAIIVLLHRFVDLYNEVMN